MYNGPYVLPVHILRLVNLSTETSGGILCLRSFNSDYKKLRNYNKTSSLIIQNHSWFTTSSLIGTILLVCQYSIVHTLASKPVKLVVITTESAYGSCHILLRIYNMYHIGERHSTFCYLPELFTLCVQFLQTVRLWIVLCNLYCGSGYGFCQNQELLLSHRRQLPEVAETLRVFPRETQKKSERVGCIQFVRQVSAEI